MRDSHARPRHARTAALEGRGAARPARPRLDRGLPPPRGRPAGRARRPDGVGARPAEVRRRGDPRPLPRAAGRPPGRDAGRAQPHRRGARGPARRRWSPTYGGCSTPTASTACPCSPPRARTGDGHRRAAARRSPSGWRTRRRPGPGSTADVARRGRDGWRDASGDAEPRDAGRRTAARARRRLRRRRRGADRGRRRSSGRPGCAPRRATGWPVTAWLSRLRPDPLKRLHLDLGDAAARSSPRRARTSVPERRPRCSGPASTPRSARCADEVSEGLARPWADAVRRASVSRLPDLDDRLDRGAVAHRPRASPDPVWCRAGAGAPVGAARSRRSPAPVWLGVLAGDRLPAGARARHARLGGLPGADGAAARRGASLGVLLALRLPACWSSATAPVAGARGRPAAARRRSPRSPSELVVEPVEAELDGLPDGARRARRRAALSPRGWTAFAVHSPARAPGVVHSRRRSGAAVRRCAARRLVVHDRRAGGTMNETFVTLQGWLGRRRDTARGRRGTRWPTFRVASHARATARNGTWVDGETPWYTVNAWRALADNVASSLRRGDPVVVHGRLRVDVWTEDQPASVTYVVEATFVGHDLNRGTSAFARRRGADRRPSRTTPCASWCTATTPDGAAARRAAARSRVEAPAARQRGRSRARLCRARRSASSGPPRRLAGSWLNTSSPCATCARPTATRSSSTTSPCRSCTAPRSASSAPTAPASRRCSRSWPGSSTPTTATRSSTPAPRSACSSRSRR